MDKPAPDIETKQLILKGINPPYIHFLFNSKSKDELMSIFGFDEKGYRHYKKMHEGGMETFKQSLFVFLLVNKESGETIGECGFHTWDQTHHRAEIFYSIHKNENKNKGFMREALPAIIAYGFKDLDLHRIQGMIEASNTPSLKLLLANKFVKEGTMREDYRVNGVNEDSDCYSLLKWEWEKQLVSSL